MAIQYVGGTTATKLGAASGNTTISLTALTGGIASAAAAGDIVIVTFVTGSTADRTLLIQDPAAVAYTLIGTELYANGTTNDTNLRVAYKFMGTTPDTTVTIGPSGNNADAAAMAVQVWRGVDTTTPFDVTTTTATGTGTGRPNPPAITPVTSGTIIGVVGGASAGTGAVFTAPALSNFRTATSADTQDAMVGVGSFAWTSGAYDPAAYTGGTTNAADSWAALTYALREKVATTFSRTAPIAGTSTVTVNRRIIRKGVAAVTAQSSLTVVAEKVSRRTASVSAQSTMNVVRRAVYRELVAITGSSTVTAASRRTFRRAAAVSAQSTLNIVGRKVIRRSVAISATSALAAVSQKRINRNAVISAVGIFRANHVKFRSVLINSAGSLAATPRRVIRRSAQFTATTGLTATKTVLHRHFITVNATSVVTAQSKRTLKRAVSVSSSSFFNAIKTTLHRHQATIHAQSTLTANYDRVYRRKVFVASQSTLSATPQTIGNVTTSASVQAVSSVSVNYSLVSVRQVSFTGVSEVIVEQPTKAFNRTVAVAANSNLSSVRKVVYKRLFTAFATGTLSASGSIAPEFDIKTVIIGSLPYQAIVGSLPYQTISGSLPYQTITGLLPYQEIEGEVPYKRIVGNGY